MKFNLTLRKTAPAVTNYEGAKAYAMTPELELYAAVATTLLSDASYEKAGGRLSRITDLVAKVSPDFAARLAVYARRQLNLRTAPVVIATELAKRAGGTDLVRRTVRGVVQRPDEITELLAYYQHSNSRSGTKKLNRLSKQVQKGLADAFNRFDAYQFAKYDRDTEVKLRDALFLVHPKPATEAQQAVFDGIAAGTLATPYTWETELSAVGQRAFENAGAKAAAVKATWEALIDSRKLGYMALLRNLRNILEAGVSGAHVEAVCGYLANETAVQNAKQLPFRFLAAYRELKAVKSGYTGMVLDALETAVRGSVTNLKTFGSETRVVVACDVSGSMQKPVSAKSAVLLYDVGLLLGMILQSKCKNVVAGMFGDRWKTVSLPAQNILSNVDAFYKREGEVGYATNGYLVVKDLADRRYVADKVMLFTDVQLWNSNTGNADSLEYQWNRYKQIAPAARLYVFDLAGYGTTPLRMERSGVALIAGWSDKVFDVLQAMESGEAALQAIQSVELKKKQNVFERTRQVP